MQIGALAGNFDVAELALALFGLFFVGLVIYLQRESNREGFPLRNLNGAALASTGLSGLPAVKTFRLPGGGQVQAPRREADETLAPHVPARFPGGPIEPLEDKFVAALGPAAYARRADVPDRGFPDGAPRIAPMRADPSYQVAAEDRTPLGAVVLAADGGVVGKVHDLWFDRAEALVRYYEIALLPEFSGRNVLVPATMADIRPNGSFVVDSLLGPQFANVPATKSLNEVTLLEEDQISAYFAAGTLYATPARAEPLL
ncbi:MAG TPA: photosynthetic reaction center subunit H [Acetobacteraceae bacterium]|nr:photosynthetic reaction center subunit H [Acetobacteraceae bacterium]